MLQLPSEKERGVASTSYTLILACRKDALAWCIRQKAVTRVQEPQNTTPLKRHRSTLRRQLLTQHECEGGLRLGVQGGGCAKDSVIEFDDVRVYVDPKSYPFLDD